MTHPLDKASVIRTFAALIGDRLAAVEAGSDAAQAGARVDGTHRPASRGERGAVSEQAALAHGLRVRAAALRSTLLQLADVPRTRRDRAGPGALVLLEDEDGGSHWWAILPGGQGDTAGGATVVSPSSPIAQALADAEPGDAVALRRDGRLKQHEVIDVR